MPVISANTVIDIHEKNLTKDEVIALLSLNLFLTATHTYSKAGKYSACVTVKN